MTATELNPRHPCLPTAATCRDSLCLCSVVSLHHTFFFFISWRFLWVLDVWLQESGKLICWCKLAGFDWLLSTVSCNAAFAFSFDTEWCEIWQFDAVGRHHPWVLQVWFKRHCHWLHWSYGSRNQLRIWPSNLLKPLKNTEAARISYNKSAWYITNHSWGLYTFNRLFNYLTEFKDLECK